MYRPVLNNLSSPPERPVEPTRRKSQRHSMGVTFEEGAKYDQTPLPTTMSLTRPSSLQTSYSTNDVPTVKNSLAFETIQSPVKTQAEQHFHNHNLSLGRIPANAVNNRQSREVNNSLFGVKEEKSNNSAQSNLQASAAPFGPSFTSSADSVNVTGPSGSYGMPQMYGYASAPYNPMSPPAMNGLQMYPTQPAPATGLTNAFGTYIKPQETNGRSSAGRRNQNDEARFNNVPLETYRGGLYELCKDQHGCRYLQRKLEEGNPEQIEMIFSETRPHIRELMTDPFGNYLCQKLFEHCNEDQRTALVDTAAPALAKIALNQHGTRALQKMIEFIHTDLQINTIIQALSDRVVELVQDLNGNHVIQKCLTRLGAERSQFIYDAVGTYCVIVGTHRHGCCVLQRCIDHAQGYQRAQLISRITACAFDLVQDPFGNYVVQYILDLDESQYTRPLCLSFAGKVVPLSKQKFSSNVIEKCLRSADMESKYGLIEEMLQGNELEKMLRDSFANYVVQTALEFADPAMKTRMTEAIRPILPSIKQTPYGRRIASKILGSSDNGRTNTTPTGQIASNDSFNQNFGSTGRSSGRRQIQIVGGGFNVPRYPTETPNDTSHQYSNGTGYGTTHNMTNDINESPVNIFSPQGFTSQPTHNGFFGYTNGSTNNYI